MAPIKFEDHIREHLQEREIQPSKDAWKKLNLQKTQPTKTNKSFTWYAVAASIISVILISSLIFRNQNTTVENTEITKENTDLPIEKKEKTTPNKATEKAIVSEEKIKNETNPEASLKNNETVKLKTNNTTIAKVEITKPEINTTETIIDNASLNESELTIKSEEDLFEEIKLNEVVAQVQALQKENNSVTIDEIDALLLKAQNDINNKNLISKNKKVDATALLEIVEIEIETSFREKVFEALGDRFEKVRTAVVERNN